MLLVSGPENIVNTYYFLFTVNTLVGENYIPVNRKKKEQGINIGTTKNEVIQVFWRGRAECLPPIKIGRAI